MDFPELKQAGGDMSFAQLRAEKAAGQDASEDVFAGLPS